MQRMNGLVSDNTSPFSSADYFHGFIYHRGHRYDPDEKVGGRSVLSGIHLCYLWLNGSGLSD